MALGLSDGDRVCIVGGGPAGSFAALHLLHLARRRQLRLEILIFEPRDFLRPGPAGCNRCAGILSSRLLRGLDELQISLPRQLIQAEVAAYAVNLDGRTLRIEHPDPERRIVSVYRGSGPRISQGEPVASFDQYLLSQACARGAQHIPERVRQVNWEGAPWARPVVQIAQGTMFADLLVLATGVNSRAPLASQFGYHPPKTEIMAQDEIVRPPTWPDDQVMIFFQQPPNLIFGALIPKGQYLNISLLGHKLTRDSVTEFIEAQDPDRLLFSASTSLCGCTPRVAVGAARRYFGTRWMTVGDAAVTRLYKDGIGSAFFTAERAVQTAIEHGISEPAFRTSYAPFCRRVATDNLYGRMLFRVWSYVLHTPSLLRAWTTVIEQEAQWPIGRRIHMRILWGMFTGDEPYRDLFRLTFSPRSVHGLARGWWYSR